MAWANELWHELSNIKSCDVLIFDLTNSSFDFQVSTPARIYRGLQRFLNKEKKGGNLSFRHHSYKKYFYMVVLIHECARIVWDTLKCMTPQNFLNSEEIDPYLRKSVHSTLAGYKGTVEYSILSNFLKFIRITISYLIVFKSTMNMLSKNDFCEVYVANGRLVNCASSAAASRKLGIPTTIIERGSHPGKFDLFDYSPHSALERRMHLEFIWKNSDPIKRRNDAETYIELRRNFDPISGIKWTRNMDSGSLPKIDRRKLCVIYTSTELEFAVFGDALNEREFESQKDAVKALIEKLAPAEWQIIIRRHPYKTRVRKDPEKRNWEFLQTYENVRVIEPDSPIDSYALANVANLVAHYDSSIGPEIIAIEKVPVVSLGTVFWEDLNSLYLLNSRDKMQRAKFDEMSVRDPQDIFPWALFMSTFGVEFRHSTWVDTKCYIHGRRIVEKRISEWL